MKSGVDCPLFVGGVSTIELIVLSGPYKTITLAPSVHLALHFSQMLAHLLHRIVELTAAQKW